MVENDASLKNRALREANIYDHGLERDHYDLTLSHCNAIWWPKVIALYRRHLLSPMAQNVLEIGSHGWAMVFLDAAEMPENFNAINISERELENGRQKASGIKARPKFHLMDAHKLEFEDNCFDVVFGFGILHHLDYVQALDEIKRVLKPGGIMIFNEPLNVNPVGQCIRRLTPKARTQDERPLELADLKLFTDRFEVNWFAHQFSSVPMGIMSRFLFKTGNNPLMKSAYYIDNMLTHIPGLKFYFRHVVITGKKLK
ncbi:MAG: class I SAM-dependent methyltransferase [bacterium]